MTTTLVCLPFAGAGASFYRPWAAYADGGLDVLPVQLPGRERRIDDEPHHDVSSAVTEVLAELRDVDGPLAIFGHSLGAVLGYELAHRLVAAGRPPVRLFVSGSPEPARPRSERATGLPDAEFLAAVSDFAGYTSEALADPELLELVLPTLRADIEMHENYVPSTDEPLDVPITALRGGADTLVDADAIQGWAKVTGRQFDHAELPGEHMYLTESAPRLVRFLTDTLQHDRGEPS
jgi:surfactin synthase thioesterase subunit